MIRLSESRQRITCIEQLIHDHVIREPSSATLANIELSAVYNNLQYSAIRNKTIPDKQWLKRHRTRRTVPSPPIYGSKRSPTSKFKKTHRNGNRSLEI